MASVEETSIESLLAAAAVDPHRTSEFVTALLDATVIVPGWFDSQDGAAEPTVTLIPLVGKQGTPVQPFFTSEDRLRETVAAVPGFESRFLAFRCRELWEMTRGSTLMLNPNSAYGKEFLPEEIGQVLDGSAVMKTRVITAKTDVLVGRPAVVPPGMEEALSTVFSHHSVVESAFLGWKVTPETGDQSYLVVVVGAPESRAEVSDELGRALVYSSLTFPVDVMYARPGDEHPLSGLEPMYVKRRRRLLSFRR